METIGTTFSGYEIFSGYIEMLYCDSLSPQLSVAERHDLERRLKTLNPQQRKNLQDAISAMEIISDINGDYGQAEHLACVASYFSRSFPTRNFAVVERDRT